VERVDFGEEKEDKGFVHVLLERNNVQYKFHSINPRPFVTIDVDLTKAQNPTDKLCRDIEHSVQPGCVLRLRYRCNPEQVSEIDESLLHAKAGQALTFKIYPEIVCLQNRGRMPQLTESSVSSPLSALETYLEEVAPERKDKLVEKAKAVMVELNGDLHGANN
jgi:exonuclease SbcD